MNHRCNLYRLLLVFSLFAAAPAQADEKPLYGSVAIDRAYGAAPHAPVLRREELNLTAAQPVAGCDAKLSGRFRYQTRLSPDAHSHGEVREARVDCRRQDWLLSVGRQAVVWGKADGFPVLDVVHPFDYREFILDDRESSRRPLTMLRAEKRVSADDYFQLLVIPERRLDILPKPADRFSEPWGAQATLLVVAGLVLVAGVAFLVGATRLRRYS